MPVATKRQIEKAYRESLSIYDEILRGRTWWSKLYLKLFWGGVSDEDIAQQLLSRIPVDIQGKILDVPVGTGIFTAHHYGQWTGAELVGVDYSEDMLEKCRRRMEGQHVAISLMQGDVGELPFEDESFDMVISMNGFHAFPDKEKAYQSCYRVLKAKGRFLGCFYIQGEIKMADRLVQKLLMPKAWFSPPFESRESLRKRLQEDYEILWFQVDGAIASFECRKREKKA